MTNESEQAELLGELSLKLSQTQSKLEMTADKLHNNKANNIVKSHVIAATSMGLIPMAAFDIAALSANQHTMLRQLCRHYAVEFDSHRSKLLITSLMGGSLPVLIIMGLSSVAKLIPGIGTLGGSAGVALSGGAITYATGQTFIKHFTKGGTLDSFVPERFSHFFKQKLKKGKQVASQLKPSAVAETISSR